MKKKFALFGNCQTHALKWLLQQSDEFKANYEEIPAIESYLMSPEVAESFCREIIPQADLIIAQPHSDRMSRWHQHEEIRSICDQHGVRSIFIPQVYFSAYNPWERGVPGISDKSEDVQLAYLDCFMLSHILDGASFETFLIETARSTGRRTNYMDQILRICLNYQSDIENRRMCDVKVLDYIKENMRSDRLMRNNNHPASKLMKLIADGVLEGLSIDFATREAPMFLNHHSLIYPFVAEHFGFNTRSSTEEIERRFRFYEKFIADLSAQDAEAVTQAFEKHRWRE